MQARLLPKLFLPLLDVLILLFLSKIELNIRIGPNYFSGESIHRRNCLRVQQIPFYSAFTDMYNIAKQLHNTHTTHFYKLTKFEQNYSYDDFY